MKSVWSMPLGLAVVLALVVGLHAQEQGKEKAKGKEVTLKGTLMCAKCELKEAAKCTNAIKVKEEGKDVVYYLNDQGPKEKYHKEICQTTKDGSVTGTLGKEKDGHKTITPKKDGVKFD